MAKLPPASSSSSLPETLQKMLSPTATISDDTPLEHASQALGLLKDLRFSAVVPDHCNSNDFYSNLIGGVLKPLTISRARVSCLLTIKPAVTNLYLGLHGEAVAAVAEAISIACARTVVAEDKEFFIGELSMSYLSGAPLNSEVIVDGNVVRSGRNITVVSVDFKLKKPASWFILLALLSITCQLPSYEAFIGDSKTFQSGTSVDTSVIFLVIQASSIWLF